MAIELELSQNQNAMTSGGIENPIMWHIRCLCYIRLNQYQKAQNDYSLLLQYIKIKEGQQMCRYIFGLILLPVEQNRKLITNYVEGLADIMNYFEVNTSSKLILNRCYSPATGWENKYTKIAEILK